MIARSSASGMVHRFKVHASRVAGVGADDRAGWPDRFQIAAKRF